MSLERTLGHFVVKKCCRKFFAFVVSFAETTWKDGNFNWQFGIFAALLLASASSKSRKPHEWGLRIFYCFGGVFGICENFPAVKILLNNSFFWSFFPCTWSRCFSVFSISSKNTSPPFCALIETVSRWVLRRSIHWDRCSQKNGNKLMTVFLVEFLWLAGVASPLWAAF